MITITTDQLEQFKQRMHITHSAEDDNLKRLLSFSVASLHSSCGEFDMETNETAKELVFERARYSYNDAIEYFEDNFLSEINSLSFDLLPDEVEEDAEV